MVISEKHKGYIVGVLLLIGFLLLIHFVGEIILPFIFALFLAYVLNPVVLRIQKKIPNRNLAITCLVGAFTLFIVGGLIFFGSYLVKDTKRLVTAVDTFIEHHEEDIKGAQEKIGSFIDGVYESDVVQQQIVSMDSVSVEEKEKDLTETLTSVYSFLSDGESQPDEEERAPWNGFLMFVYTIIYLVMILYTYNYFEARYRKYFKGKQPMNPFFQGVWLDFKGVFLSYFRQRTLVVLISMGIFVLAFSIMDLPGAIILGILTGLLTYASHFHYLSLPMVAIGCWVLSVETDWNFFVFFGILLGVYILISILEEFVFYEKIMKSAKGMNPAVMVLAFVLWVYLLGGFIGTVLAIPLTQLILIYLGKIITYQQEKLDIKSEETPQLEK
ncbi:MAG: AI-2E family transporter [Crocinitomicaceae bacterium]